MRTVFGLAAAALVATLGAAFAQSDFPSRPVTIVVPYAAGGASDIQTRILADELSKVWHQPVTVENKPGGATLIGAAAVLSAPADGYTMLQVGGSFSINPAVRKNMPFDTLKAFRGVSLLIDTPNAIFANPNFGPNTVGELIAEARKRNVTYGTPGVASTTHMVAELIQKRAGVTFEHIPYSGEAQALPDALAGRFDFFFGPWSTNRQYVEAGKMKLLGISYKRRLEAAPDTPTIYEQVPAMAGDPIGGWTGVVVRRETPDDVMQKIGEGFKAALNSATYQERITAGGSFPAYTTPEETDAFLAKEIATWTEVAKAANISVD